MTRSRNPSGCGWIMAAVVGLPIIAMLATWGAGLVAFIVAAPVLVPFLLLEQPAQFHHDQTMWLLALCAAPFAAAALAAARPPARVVGRPWEHTGPYGLDQGDRRARRHRHYLQTLLLLVVANVVALIVLARGNTATGPHAFAQTMSLVGSVLVPCLLLPVAFRCWDHWSPPIGAAVTVEAVRKAEREAARKLQTIREQNDAVQQMIRRVEQQLAAARREVRFETLSAAHDTSARCSNVAYRHYESAKATSRFTGGFAARARATAAPRLVPLRDPGTGRRTRPQSAELRAGASTLSAHSRAIAHERARGLQYVNTLNLRTGDLRDTIRDTCGRRGQRWYGDLIQRRDYLRAMEA